MKYLINGTLRPERTREELVEKIEGKLISDEAWDLVRTGVVTEHGFKIGQRPGFIFVIEGDSEEAVRATISNIPVVQGGLVRYRSRSAEPVPFRSSLAYRRHPSRIQRRL